MKLQLKFETVPVFHWNDQSELDENEVMKRVEERKGDMQHFWDTPTHAGSFRNLLLDFDSPIRDILSYMTSDNVKVSGNGEKLEFLITYYVELLDDYTWVDISGKLDKIGVYACDYIIEVLDSDNLGLEVGILYNEDEELDAFWVSVTCDYSKTSCYVEITE